MTVLVKFEYEPEQPDDDDSTGMASEEFDDLHDRLVALGADNITMEKKA